MENTITYCPPGRNVSRMVHCAQLEPGKTQLKRVDDAGEIETSRHNTATKTLPIHYLLSLIIITMAGCTISFDQDDRKLFLIIWRRKHEKQR